MAADLGRCELYAQSHDIGNQVEREYLQEAVPYHLPEAHVCAGGKIVLVAYVVDSEEQGGDQGDHHDDHDSLEVIAVPDVRAALRDGIGYSQE